MFYEHRSSLENLDGIMGDMGKPRTKLEREIEMLKDQNDIKKIEKLNSLHIDSLKLSLWESKNRYSHGRMMVRIDGSKELYELLKIKSGIREGIRNGSHEYTTFDFLVFEISEENKKEHYDQFVDFIDSLAIEDEPIHQENIKKVEQNQKTKQAVFNLLKRIGIGNSYYGFSSKRSTKKSEQFYNFTSEIGGQIPTYYQESNIEDMKKSLVKQFSELYDPEVKKMRDARLAKEREESERLANKKLALLLAKYDLDLESEWSDILERIIERNKYLRLAYFLERNRNDWNDGDWYARRGLDGFAIETDDDQLIYEDISGHTGENWDMDGRVFRDCKYNYGVLYGMSEEQNSDLYRDYETVREQMGDD